MGIEIDLTRNNKTRKIRLILKGRPYMDSVFEVSPIVMEPNDTLEVTVDVTIEAYIDGEWSSSYNDKYRYLTDKIEEQITVRFIRFTKYKSRANIQISEQLPQEFYTPPTWNAKRKRL